MLFEFQMIYYMYIITIYVPTAARQSNYNEFEHDTFLFWDVRDVFEPFFYPERSEG